MLLLISSVLCCVSASSANRDDHFAADSISLVKTMLQFACHVLNVSALYKTGAAAEDKSFQIMKKFI